MFAYILVYVFGIGTGAGLLIANRRSVDKAVNTEKVRSQQIIDRLRKENDQAWQERNELIRQRDINRAYHEGRKSPLSEVERFAETLESHGAKFVNTSAKPSGKAG
jgi:hypothetical protein